MCMSIDGIYLFGYWLVGKIQDLTWMPKAKSSRVKRATLKFAI